MSFLPAAAIVNAAAKSAKQYLAFLHKNRAGVEMHRAKDIRLAENSSFLLENATWSIYYCELPKHLTVRSDSSATLKADAAPGSEIEIRILEYDRRTGQTEFASCVVVLGKTGGIVIDFRWLVQRCLEWLERRGSSVAEIKEIASCPPGDLKLLVGNDGLSNEQREAITTVLTSGLSYICGPPGTGKTKWVLAKAVRHCVEQEEKVLVLASTNLAVDNALSAIIEEGVSQEQIARIGVPSPRFIEDYPDCCEERAFEYEIRQIKSQIKTAEDNIAFLNRRNLLAGQVKEWEAKLRIKRHEFFEGETRLAATQEELSDSMATLCQRKKELEPIEAEHKTKRRELDDLAVPQLLSDIDSLESEQARTLKEVDKMNKRLTTLGVVRRIFTGRKHELINQISKERAHICSVEATLESRRKKWNELSPLATRLKADIAKLEPACEKAHREIVGLKNRASGLEEKQRLLQTTVSECRENVRSLESRIGDATEELSRIGERYPTEQTDALRATWLAEKDQLEVCLSQFKQDLTGKSVLGMTLDGFIGLTLHMNLSINRVFIDEAPYAPIAKALPLLSLRCPIAMLGDHRQLPPVCECANDATIRAYWAKPAIFLEDAYRIGDRWHDLHRLEEPQFRLTQRAVLRASYRFGQSLASLLDRHIYNIGLVGLAKDDTCIRCIHCEPLNKGGPNRRKNDAEAGAILKQLEEWWIWAQQQSNLPTIAILTPYRNQVRLIRDELKRRFRDSGISDHVEVWNTHQAQGREWDWVMFSVSDTANLKGNMPYFSDSRNRTGRAVLNTTISRTKQHLRIFLDSTYWEYRKPESLLTELVRFEGGHK